MTRFPRILGKIEQERVENQARYDLETSGEAFPELRDDVETIRVALEFVLDDTVAARALAALQRLDARAQNGSMSASGARPLSEHCPATDGARERQ